MLRVAHREHAGHRERGHRVVEIGDRTVQRVEIQCPACTARGVVTAADPDAGSPTQRVDDSRPRRGGLVEADEHQAHPPALPFDERVGGERGGERDERDAGGVDTRMLQHCLGGVVNADGEIVPGGQHLRRRHDLPRPLVVQHRVGIRAAGVDAEQGGHGEMDSVRGTAQAEERSGTCGAAIAEPR